MIPDKEIKPLTLRVQEGKCVLMGGLARVELLQVLHCTVLRTSLLVRRVLMKMQELLIYVFLLDGFVVDDASTFYVEFEFFTYFNFIICV